MARATFDEPLQIRRISMRVSQRGIRRGEQAFGLDFEGQALNAYPGESLAAAMVAAGQLACRETRSGEPRGVFCGMGVCGECSVLVDGQPARACMVPARPGLVVRRQPALRSVTPAGGEELPGPGDWENRDVEVLVIGAGPAGLAAATAAARAGAEVLLVDERAKAGGQYFKQPGEGFAIDERRIDPQFREGLELYRAALAAGVEFCFGATVWGAFTGPQVAISLASGNRLLRARRVIVSPGAYERPLPFSGWTLPGVMTTGAAQTLLRAYQTAPGQRVLVAGNGPLNLQVARELVSAGVEVVAVAELAAGPSLSRLPDALKMGLNSPRLVLEGLGHVLRLARARVPVLYGQRITGAAGAGRVQRASVARIDRSGEIISGTARDFAVDAVCVGYGFLAQSEIARAMGAEHVVNEARGTQEVLRDESGRSTTAQEVFIAGDARGLGGARVAITQGSLAGASAAADLGYGDAAAAQAGRRSDLRTLRRHRRFQAALWSFYRAPQNALTTATDDTIICRCESVTLGRVRELMDSGLSSLGAIKRESRAGMGRCQGRYCAGLMTQLCREAGIAVAEPESHFAPRPPFKPLTVAALAAAHNPQLVFDRSAGAKAGPATASAVLLDEKPGKEASA